MPNWCFCDLSISGKAGVLKELLEAADKGCWPGATDFRGLLNFCKPCPAGKENEFDFIGEWGTKWEVSSYDTSDDDVLDMDDDVDAHIYITFRTAWSPPIPAIRALIDKEGIHNVELSYHASLEENGIWESESGGPGRHAEYDLTQIDSVEEFNSGDLADLEGRFGIMEYWKDWREDQDLPVE